MYDTSAFMQPGKRRLNKGKSSLLLILFTRWRQQMSTVNRSCPFTRLHRVFATDENCSRQFNLLRFCFCFISLQNRSVAGSVLLRSEINCFINLAIFSVCCSLTSFCIVLVVNFVLFLCCFNFHIF